MDSLHQQLCHSDEQISASITSHCKTMDHAGDVLTISVWVTDVYHNLLSNHSTIVRQVRRINYLIILYSS